MRLNKTTKDSAPVTRLAYSLQEGADSLGISYISMWRLCQRGKIRAVKALRTYIIPATEMERFLAGDTEETTTVANAKR